MAAKNKEKIYKLTLTAVLTALIFVMAFTPIGYLSNCRWTRCRLGSRHNVRRNELYTVLWYGRIRNNSFRNQSRVHIHNVFHTESSYGIILRTYL